MAEVAGILWLPQQAHSAPVARAEERRTGQRKDQTFAHCGGEDRFRPCRAQVCPDARKGRGGHRRFIVASPLKAACLAWSCAVAAHLTRRLTVRPCAAATRWPTGRRSWACRPSGRFARSARSRDNCGTLRQEDTIEALGNRAVFFLSREYAHLPCPAPDPGYHHCRRADDA